MTTNSLKIYQVDAFANKLFAGNPAAVCILDQWLDDEQMQAIAAENNLAETAFVLKKRQNFTIRWFTPTVEVDLCGHATLAAAFVIYELTDYSQGEIQFYSPRSGALSVNKEGDYLFLNFPTDYLREVDHILMLGECIGISPQETLKGKTDFIAILEKESDIVNLKP